jgi:trans-aconitate 2-methyltransferase
MPTWDKDLYYRFRAQRTQPSIDLVARIECDQVDDAVDLGCGAGNSTAVLRNRWPDASIVGTDNSDEMLRAAQETDDAVQWLLADIATWQPDQPFDVVFSNAALQWLPDHQSLIPRLFEWVREGGVLAVQLPDHYASALYQVLIDVSNDPRWSARMDAARSSLTRHTVSFYYDLLSSLTDRFDIWTTEYHHELQTHEDILTFHRGTGMRPYLESLSESEVDSFEKIVLEGYRNAFPVQANGRVLFPFRRLFFIAQA